MNHLTCFREEESFVSFGITLSENFSVISYNLISSNIQLYISVAMNRVKFRSNIWSYDSSLIHCISHLLFYKGSLLVPGSWDKSREGFVLSRVITCLKSERGTLYWQKFLHRGLGRRWGVSARLWPGRSWEKQDVVFVAPWWKKFVPNFLSLWSSLLIFIARWLEVTISNCVEFHT